VFAGHQSALIDIGHGLLLSLSAVRCSDPTV